jgi:hypothetical protein
MSTTPARVDGCPFVFSGETKQIGLFLYSPDAIRLLVANPDQVVDWPCCSAEAPAFHRQTRPGY